MPKYLLEAHYSTEGAKGVMKEGGSGRRAAVAKMAEGVGGKLESLYFAFGGEDAFAVVDLPDNVTAAAVALAVSQSGAASLKTIVLLTPEDMDKAAKKSVEYGRRALILDRRRRAFERAGASCYGGRRRGSTWIATNPRSCC